MNAPTHPFIGADAELAHWTMDELLERRTDASREAHRLLAEVGRINTEISHRIEEDDARHR